MISGEKNKRIKIRILPDPLPEIVHFLAHRFPRIDVLLPTTWQETFSEESSSRILHLIVDYPEQPVQLRLLEQMSQQQIPFAVIGKGVSRETILEIFRAGARDYIENSADFAESLSKTLQKYIVEYQQTINSPRCVTFLGTNGGVGTTTLVANLGPELAGKTHETLLIDVAQRAGDLASLLNLHPAHTLEDLFQTQLQLDAEVLRQSTVSFNPCVSVLTSRDDSRSANPQLQGEDLLELIKVATQEFSYTLFDAGCRSPEFIHPLIPQTDLFVAPFQANLISLRRLRYYLNFLREAGVQEEEILLIENRRQSQESFPRNQMEKILKHEVQLSLPDDSFTFSRSLNCGIPVSQLEEKNTALKALQKIAETISCKLRGPAPVPQHSQKLSVVRRLAGCLGFM